MLILDRHSREDELAPGIVIIMSLISGMIFAVVGSFIQNYLSKNS
ncbi:hypothetical protein [Mucilaginibacter panaciglaebae]